MDNERKIKNFYLESKEYKVLDKKTSNNKYILGRFKALFLTLNKVTKNGTCYTTEWANKTIFNNKEFQTRLKKKLILGRLDHPNRHKDGDDITSKVENASHCLIDVKKVGDELWGIFEVFNTIPYGQNLWALLNAGVVLNLSLRGYGDEYFKDGVRYASEEGFELFGIDIVTDASSVGAEFKEFTESKRNEILSKFNKIQNIYGKDYKKYFLESLIKEEKNKIEILRKNKELERYKEELHKIETERNKLKKEFEELYKRYEEIKKECKRKDLEVEENRKVFESRKEVLEKYEEKIKELKEENEVYKNEISNLKKRIENLKEENERKYLESSNNKIEVFINNKEENIIDRNDIDFIKRIMGNKKGFYRK